MTTPVPDSTPRWLRTALWVSLLVVTGALAYGAAARQGWVSADPFPKSTLYLLGAVGCQAGMLLVWRRSASAGIVLVLGQVVLLGFSIAALAGGY